MIKIEQTGLRSALVDCGRLHAQASGFSQSGALDWVNYQLANALCGVPLDAVNIEVLGGVFECTFKVSTLIALTGAKLDIYINQRKVERNTVYQVVAGDKLRLTNLRNGFSSYLAFNSRIEASQFSRSVCAVKREKAGGLRNDGQALVAGDTVTFNKYKPPKCQGKRNAKATLPKILQDYTLDCLRQHRHVIIRAAYQSASFSYKDILNLFSNRFTVSQYFDRMGMRLKGEKSLRKHSGDFTIYSQAIAFGSVQVPQNGQAIILRNDRQTIGGYPIIGVIDSLSMSMLGQAKANDSLSFEADETYKNETKTRMIVAALHDVFQKQAKASA